jgi:hypothetical protein
MRAKPARRGEPDVEHCRGIAPRHRRHHMRGKQRQPRNAAAPQVSTLNDKEPALMEHQDKAAPGHGPRHETALEEIARETRTTSVRTWAVTGVIAAGLLTVMYAVTIHRADEEAAHRSAVNSEIQSQTAGAQDVAGGIPRPGGA